MMTADIERFWIEKARQPNWRDYILPRKDAGDFDYEGWIEAQRLFYFIGFP